MKYNKGLGVIGCVFLMLILIKCMVDKKSNLFEKQSTTIVKKMNRDSLIVQFGNYQIHLFNHSTYLNDYLNKGNFLVKNGDKVVAQYSGEVFQNLENDPVTFINKNTDCFVMFLKHKNDSKFFLDAYYFKNNTIQILGESHLIKEKDCNALYSAEKIELRVDSLKIDMKFNENSLIINRNVSSIKLGEEWYGVYNVQYDDVWYTLIIDEQTIEFNGTGYRYSFIENCTIESLNKNILKLNFKYLYKGMDGGHNEIIPLVELSHVQGKYYITSKLFDDSKIKVEKISLSNK